MENQKISKEGTSDKKGKSSAEVFQEMLKTAGSTKTSAHENIVIQGLLMSGKLDSIILNQRASDDEIKSQMVNAAANSKLILKCTGYKAQLAVCSQLVLQLEAEKKLLNENYNKFCKIYEEKPPEEQKSQEEEKEKKYNECLEVESKLTQANAKAPIMEKRLMAFFAEDLLNTSPKIFAKDVEERVDKFFEEQEKARMAGIAAEIENSRRRAISDNLRKEILAGEADLEKQKNRNAIFRYLENKQISATDQLQLTEDIEKEYAEILKESQEKNKSKRLSKGGLSGNLGQKSETEVAQEKARREKAMRDAMEKVSGHFLKKNKPAVREKMLTPLKHYISNRAGGESEIVQNVLAEFLFEKDSDATGEQAKRKYDDMDIKFAPNEELLKALKDRKNTVLAGEEIEKTADEQKLAQQEEEGEAIVNQISEVEEAATTESAKKEELDEEKKLAKAEEKASRKAARKVVWRTATINPIVKTVGEIYNLLRVSFEAIKFDQGKVEWALSTIIMKYGDNLIKLTDDALVSAVYSLSCEFKVKLTAFETFVDLKPVAAVEKDTFSEFNDRVQMLSMQLGSANANEFCDICADAIKFFLLYCFTYKCVKEKMDIYAEKNEAVTYDEKQRATHALIKIIRGSVEAGAISNKEAIEKSVTEKLDNDMTNKLLLQSGYISQSASKNTIDAED
ncbi:MAG: hypothetical protein RR315_03240, partial [Oscillospiraceae bacterium]